LLRMASATAIALQVLAQAEARLAVRQLADE
jgi:hypothetical protein